MRPCMSDDSHDDYSDTDPRGHRQPGPAAWAATAGRIERLVLPGGPGVRVDTHAYQGYAMSPYYDPLLAKVIVVAPSREAAVHKLEHPLAQFVCEGVTTNADFHRRLLHWPAFRSGEYRLDVVPTFLADDRRGLSHAH
jgi:biotin carboxylase